MSTLKHLRSSVSNKRPTASGLVDGQLGINTASGTPGLYFRNTASGIVKVGPAHVGTTAPNAVPAGSAGNSTGEFWVDNSLTTHGLKYYTGSTFYNLTPSGTTSNSGLVELATNAETQAGSDTERAVTPASLQSKVSDSVSTTSSTTIASATAVKSAYDLANAALPKSGGTVTGELLLGTSGSLVFEGSVDDGFETTLAVANPTADRTITLPNTTGTVVTTGDTGSVTSTMIANDTIVDADINTAAAIAFSKLATGTLPSGITVNSNNIVDGSIVNADINATAAIAGTKISPDFGNQTIATTGRIGVGTTSPSTNVQLTSSAPTATIGNIYIAPTTAGQARYQLYNNGATAEWIFGQKTSTNHDFVLSKSVAGSESDYLIIDTSGNVNFQSTGTRVRNGQIIDCSGSTGSLTLYGGNSDGANIELYGASHATLANLAVFDAGEHRFRSSDGLTERARIDSSGRLLVGASTSQGLGGKLQVGGDPIGGASTNLSVNSFGYPGYVRMSRAGLGAIGVAVTAGNRIGELCFDGYTGSAYAQTATVASEVDGTPSLTSMPGRLVFSTTPSGSVLPVERMRITNDGKVGIGTGAPAADLHVANAAGGRIRVGGAANAGVEFNGTDTRIDIPAANSLAFYTSSNERVRIDSSGRLLVGTSTALSVTGGTETPLTQIVGATPQFFIFNRSADAAPAHYIIGKSRGTSNQSILSGDNIGLISFQGADGTNLIRGCEIRAQVDGVPSGATVPGRLLFSTTADSAAPVERMRISGAGTTTLTSAAGTAPFIANISTTEAARIDNAGRLLVGTSASILGGSLQIGSNTGTTQPNAQLISSNDAAYLWIARSNAGAAVVDNNNLGGITFRGSDGTNYIRCAEISSAVDGTPGTNDMPGRLVFSTTADGASSPTERLRITNSGLVAYDQPTPLARNTSTTLTVADLKTKIIVSAPASGITLTLPSGGLLEADFPSIYTGVTFDWSIINTSATNAITLASGVGHTIVGSGGVAPNISARFTTRRTATSNTFISYRLC